MLFSKGKNLLNNVSTYYGMNSVTSVEYTVVMNSDALKSVITEIGKLYHLSTINDFLLLKSLIILYSKILQ